MGFFDTAGKCGRFMLQIAICDDEKYYRETIRLLLTEYLEKRGLEYTHISVRRRVLEPAGKRREI